MSFSLMFFIIDIVFLILGIIGFIVIYKIKNDTIIAFTLIRVLSLAVLSFSFLTCLIFSAIINYLAIDYLTTIGKVIEDKEIIEIQANDKLLQDSVAITYKDSDGSSVIYNTTLPWYCDIEVEQSEKTFVEIDSSHNIFCIHNGVLKESGSTYTSKK